MQAEQLLTNVWGVWFSFSSGNKSQANYGNNLQRLFYLKNWADLAYLWTQSDVKDPNIYFANPLIGEYTKFEVNGDMRKVQSINFFKDPIQPTWEYGDNSKGGYYNFSINAQASSQTVKQIYQILVFMALGESINFANSIRGIRIVDTTAKKKFRCRFQIWVDYGQKDENLDMIKKHSYQLKQILQNEKIPLSKINFYNIGGKSQNQQEKNDKPVEKAQ